MPTCFRLLTQLIRFALAGWLGFGSNQKTATTITTRSSSVRVNAALLFGEIFMTAFASLLFFLLFTRRLHTFLSQRCQFFHLSKQANRPALRAHPGFAVHDAVFQRPEFCL